MTIFKKAIPRRTLLRGVGAALALPLLDGMIPAFAAPIKPKLRLGFVYVPNGLNLRQWTPTTEGAGFEMSPTLAALAPLREHVLVLTGLDHNQALGLPGEGGAFHTRTTVAYLTGVHPKYTKGADVYAGVSVDQVAAKELGKQTQIASLELALDQGENTGICESEYSCAYFNTLCWRTPTTPLPMENQPREVFERLFGDREATSAVARLARIRENRSLLDSVIDEVGDMKLGLGAKDRAKLNEYLEAIRDIERRIELAEKQGATELPTLDRPTAIPPSFEDYANLMFDMQVLAYQADLTRVATFRVGKEQSGRTYSQIGVSESHHSVSHDRGDPELMAKHALINAYHVKIFSYYLDKLRSTPDGDGSLLDHSMIVYGSGMSDGNMHVNQNLPVLLAGGGAGQIKGGRHIRYHKGTPMTNLYLTLLDKMGIRVDSFGDSTGRLDLNA